MFCSQDGTKLEFLNSIAREEDPELAKRVVADYPSLFGDEEEDKEKDDDAPLLEGNGLDFKSAANSLVGQTIDRQYEILSVIGSGGMSVVYVAKDLRLKKIIALKMMLPHLVANPLSMQRFQQEAEAASNLNHPNVVAVHNFGVSKSTQPYLIMDYCQGIPLGNLIAEKGRLELDRAVPIFIQIAGALAHAHEKGVIHRDLKPSNILITQSTEQHDLVKIVDFGIAKILPQEGREAAQLTQTGEVFGSPMYMSPEQCRGEKLDARSDIYSMGCVMYETLAGNPPIQGANMLEILFRHINEMPPRIIQTTDGQPFPAKLEAIVFKSLAKEPNERYQTMSDLREDLVRYQREQTHTFLDTLAARFQISWHKRRVWKKSEKIAFGTALIGFILAAVMGTWLTTLYVSAANSPYAHIDVSWKENTPPPEPLPSEAAVSKADLEVRELKHMADGVSQDIKKTPAGAYSIIEEALKRLSAAAEANYNAGLWEQAAQLYSTALTLLDQSPDTQDMVPPQSSMSKQSMLTNLGFCYFKTKQYSLAAQAYDALVKLEAHNQQPYTIAQHLAMQGDCYYFQKKWAEAKKSYNAARYVLMRTRDPEHASDPSGTHYCLGSWFVPIENNLALITTGRFADACRQLGPSDPEKPKLFTEAAYHYHQCASSMAARHPEPGTPELQNLAVSHFYLAECAPQVPALKWAYLQRDDHPGNASGPTIDDYYKKACEEMRQAVGDRSPMYAAVLKGYADYLWSKSDFVDGLKYKIQSLQALSQANSAVPGLSPR